MKGFIRFIVCVIVLACIVFIALYLTDSKGLLKKNKPVVDIPLDKNEILIKTSGDDDSQDESGENEAITSKEPGEIDNVNTSGESQANVSGEKEIIDALAKDLDSKPNVKTLNTGITSQIGGKSVSELLDAFEETSDVLLATVYVKKGRIEISYITDFVDNQVFYFDEENNLVLYKTISNTVGGEARYYFKEGNNIAIDFDYDEEQANQNAVAENASEILNRAKLVLENY